jgi:hypothetical protein
MQPKKNYEYINRNITYVVNVLKKYPKETAIKF